MNIFGFGNTLFLENHLCKEIYKLLKWVLNDGMNIKAHIYQTN
jgi:hypothetical protein